MITTEMLGSAGHLLAALRKAGLTPDMLFSYDHKQADRDGIVFQFSRSIAEVEVHIHDGCTVDVVFSIDHSQPSWAAEVSCDEASLDAAVSAIDRFLDGNTIDPDRFARHHR